MLNVMVPLGRHWTGMGDVAFSSTKNIAGFSVAETWHRHQVTGHQELQVRFNPSNRGGVYSLVSASEARGRAHQVIRARLAGDEPAGPIRLTRADITMDFWGAPRGLPQAWHSGYVPPARASKSLRENRQGDATFYIHSGRKGSEAGQIRIYAKGEGRLRVEVQAQQGWLGQCGIEDRLLENLTEASAKDVFMNRFEWASLGTPLVGPARLAHRLRDYRDESGKELPGATLLAILGQALAVHEGLGDLGASDPTIRKYVRILEECGWLAGKGFVSDVEVRLDPATGEAHIDSRAAPASRGSDRPGNKQT